MRPQHIPRAATIGAIALLLVSACKDASEPPKILRATEIDDKQLLIGGPLAHGQVGDFLIENDQVRFVISGAHHSWGPGLFGGTVVDADLQRSNPKYRNYAGNDHFAELFPTANLIVPDPGSTQIVVTADGSDGEKAQITVEGTGVVFIEGLALLDANPEGTGEFSSLLASLGVQTAFDFKTVYTLRPNKRFLEIETTVRRPDFAVTNTEACASALEGCDLVCSGGYRSNPETGCLMCKCDGPKNLPPFTEPAPLLALMLGDGLNAYTGADALRPGVVGGDFLFFGGGTDVFVPGLGFDEKGKVFDNLFRGVDTITSPLTFPWIASVGEDVSYAIFNVREEKPEVCAHRVVATRLLDASKRQALIDALVADFGKDAKRVAPKVTDLVEQRIPLPIHLGVAESELTATLEATSAVLGDLAELDTELDGDCREPQLLVPLFTSSATMVVGAGVACLSQDDSDNESCDEHRTFRFKRYLAVGEGDVDSVARTVWRAKGQGLGTVSGIVFDQNVGKAHPRADVFALYDPDTTKTFETYREVIAANEEATTRFGIMNHVKADVGVDPKRTGRFEMMLPAGSWLLVARSADGVLSKPVRVAVPEGGEAVAIPVIEAPARLDFRVLNESGGTMPAKLTLQAMNEDGQVLYADGKRRVELGNGRLENGIFKVIYSATGHGLEKVEPGRYRITASRGTEYSIHTQDIVLKPGQTHSLTAQIQHEVDTSGFISGDFHLHAAPSMDSGLKLSDRVTTLVVEGVELLSSSDHDVITDYRPTLLKLGLDKWATTQVGTEVSTLEIGHFLGFPLAYDHTQVPVHNAVDWVCMSHHEIFAAIRERGRFTPEETVVTVAHPRDGFFGYFDGMGMSPWTTERGDAGLQANNPLFKTVSCDFDSIELLNGKRFELIRTPTVSEVNDAERCLAEINAAITNVEIRAACEWLRKPAACEGGAETFREEPCSWYAEMAEDFETCADADSPALCKDKARNATTLLIVRRIMTRTPGEDAAWHDADEVVRDPDQTKCRPEFLAEILEGKQTLEPADEIAPCSQHEGVVDDWFTLLNHGMHVTAMGNSDSHGKGLEPGIPRNFIASSTDNAAHIDQREIAKNIKAGKVVPSTGPFVRVSIDGAGLGETATVAAGAKVQLKLQVQTPSWFGVSRIEVFRNGRLVHVEDTSATSPGEIVDFDGVIELDRPDQDSWYTVSAFGLRRGDFLGPVYVKVALGELSLQKITSLAFANLGLIGALLGKDSQVVDYFPAFPYAMTNPIFVDLDGDGYQPPLDKPAFCPRGCAPAYDDAGLPTQADCGDGEVCHRGSDVGLAGDGYCGRPTVGDGAICTVDKLVTAQKTATREGALRVGPRRGVRSPFAGLSADEGKARASAKRLLSRAVGITIWEEFKHGNHAD